MSTSLITGGAGFIGSHVARHCLNLGHKVVILDDLSGGFEENLSEKSVFIKGSINDVNLLEKIFDEYQFDYVYHLAAYAAEGLSHFIRRFNYENNLIGSINLINLSIKHEIKCFVFTSSIAVYGAGQLPMAEDMVPIPEDPYGIAKFAIEMDLKCAHEMFGLNSIIFRPHNVYGEYQNIGDMYRNVIGIFMNQIMQKKPITVFGDGTQSRAFSYIDDVAPIISSSVENKNAYNQIFNIGADTPYSINELISVISESFNVSPEVIYSAKRNEVLHAHSEHKKVADYFGYKEPTSLNDGIHKMKKWVEERGIQKTTKFANIEIEKNLPSFWL
jgi:UDP-glucose 4-epimerase